MGVYMKKLIAVGDVFKMKDGSEYIVLDYQGISNITAQSLCAHGHTVKVIGQQLRGGTIKNPFLPSVYGVGYMGVGKHSSKSKEKGRACMAYKTWAGMLERCYANETREILKTYIDCSVCIDWHNFQNFAVWFYAQEFSLRKDFQLDKDLKVIGNRVYGPETCSFVPQSINKVITGCGVKDRDLPLGVSRHSTGFRAHANVIGRRITGSVRATANEAAQDYKLWKEDHLKALSEEWKDFIDPLVRDNLKRWIVPA